MNALNSSMKQNSQTFHQKMKFTNVSAWFSQLSRHLRCICVTMFYQKSLNHSHKMKKSVFRYFTKEIIVLFVLSKIFNNRANDWTFARVEEKKKKINWKRKVSFIVEIHFRKQWMTKWQRMNENDTSINWNSQKRKNSQIKTFSSVIMKSLIKHQ